MKITVVSSTVFSLTDTGLSGYGGLEQIAWQCAKGLAQKGHEVTFVAPDDSTCEGCDVIHTGEARQHDERQAYDVFWKVLLTQDCVIDHSWAKWSYILKMEGRLKAPVMGVMHAPIHTMIQSLPPIESPCFVCISEDQRKHFEGLFGQEARTCYNGIDLEQYQAANVPRTDRYLFLARFSTVKSPDLCLEACYQANAGLDLIGDQSITNEPDYLNKCTQMASRTSSDWNSNKGKQFRLIGPSSRGGAVWWYSQAHAMLHLTKSFREPFGLAPVEAMACECPVIGWSGGALKETIKDKETGFLVKSVEQAIDLIKSDAVSSINRKRCREWVSQFSVDKMVSRYNELVEEAVNGGW